MHPFEKIKQSCFSKIFESDWYNIKNTLKGTKSLIALKKYFYPSVPRTLNPINSAISIPVEIAKF